MLEQVPAAGAARDSVDSGEAKIVQEAISALAYSLGRAEGVPKERPTKTGLTRKKF